MLKRILIIAASSLVLLVGTLAYFGERAEATFTREDWEKRQRDDTNGSYKVAQGLVEKIPNEKWTRTKVLEELGEPDWGYKGRKDLKAGLFTYVVHRYDWRGRPNTNTLEVMFSAGGDEVLSVRLSED